MLSSRLRSAYLDAIPSLLKKKDRWVLSPFLKNVRKLNGEETSSGDTSAFLPFKIASSCYRSGVEIGFVVGDGISVVRGECSDFFRNVGIIWRWPPAVARRNQDHIYWIYSGGDLTNSDGTRCKNKQNKMLTFGFEGWAFNIVGQPVGFATELTPYDRQNLPYQKRSILEALRIEEANSKNRIAAMQAEIAELMKQ